MFSVVYHNFWPGTLISNIEAEMDNLKDVISSSLSVYHVDDSNLLLYNRSEEEWPETSQISFDSDVTDLTNRLEGDKDSEEEDEVEGVQPGETFGDVLIFSGDFWCFWCFSMIDEERPQVQYGQSWI